MKTTGNDWNGSRFPAHRVGGAVLAALVLFAGCGRTDGTYDLRGKVTYQGQPVTHGTVMFNPTSAGSPPVLGRIGSDGTYQVRAAPGEYKVLVTVMTEVDPNLEPDAPGYTPSKSLIPARYSNPLATPLQAIVTEGSNVVDLEL
jgi:hypothetical protein